ncbi:MAG: AIR synthase family protein [Candidatus Bathyarchaeia archaeon]|nr:AIR synthase family protein [Candidatus Bathyarchaeota archaeon]
MRLPFGKVPSEVLEAYVYPYLGAERDDVVLGPARGEDAAVVDAGKTLVASSCDPISGALSHIGWLAVNISANDVSTLGVRPRWFHSCILLPEGSSVEDLAVVSHQIHEAAEELDIAVVGGHSEVTPGLSHPVVVGFCMGVAAGGRYVTSSGAKPGGRIILTKGVAIEGTAIICSDKAEQVRSILGEEVWRRGSDYIRMISVVKEALAAFDFGGVQAMHDPTEGGVAGGLHELADASRCGFKIYEDKLLIKPETRIICEAFNLDPLRLISSGALLIAADRDKAEPLVEYLGGMGVPASIIGEVVEDPSHRRIIALNGEELDLARPEMDELWRISPKGGGHAAARV